MQRSEKRRIRPTENDLNICSPDTNPKNVFNKYVLAVVVGESPAYRFLEFPKWSKIFEFMAYVKSIQDNANTSLANTVFDKDRAMQVFCFWKDHDFQKQDTILMWLSKTTTVMHILSRFITREIVIEVIDNYESHFLKRRKIWENLLEYDIQAEKRNVLALLNVFLEDIKKIAETTIPNPNLVEPQETQIAAFNREFNTASRTNPEAFNSARPCHWINTLP